MTTKTCTKCGETKLFELFYKHKLTKDGYHTRCKTCQALHHKQYAENNKEKIALRQKQYVENNREKVALCKKTNYENNKEKIALTHKQYAENNKEKIALRKKQYVENNREKVALCSKRHQAKNVSTLNYNYVKSLLIRDTTLTAKDIPQELVELKRLELQINRKIKELSK